MEEITKLNEIIKTIAAENFPGFGRALNAPTPDHLLSIEERLVVNLEDHHDLINPNQFDKLTERCLALVDRFFSDRYEFALLSRQRLELEMEVEKFVEDSKILDTEISQGKFRIGRERVEAEIIRVTERISHFDTSIKRLSTMEVLMGSLVEEYSDSNRKNFVDANAIISQLSGLFLDEKSNKEKSYMSYSFDKSIGGDLSQKTYHWADQMQSRLSDRQFSLEELRAKRVKEEVSNRLESEESQLVILENKLQEMQNELNLEIAEEKASMDRVLLERRIFAKKLQDLLRAGGAFNFSDQVDSLKKRMGRDLTELVAMLEPIFFGASHYTGYTRYTGFDASSVKFMIDEFREGKGESSSNVDSIAQAIRDAHAFLQSFLLLDQSAFMPISIRSMLSDTDWQHLLSGLEVKFEVPDSIFPNSVFVRSRGLSVFSSRINNPEVVMDIGPDADEDIIMASIQLPRSGSVKNRYGNVYQVDQSFLTPLVAGRVGQRGRIQTPDIIGTHTLNNVSPFGEWKIRVHDRFDAGGHFGPLEDIEIDIFASFHSI